MIFATVAIGENTRNDLMHLLNDIRNIDQRIYVYTDLEIDLNKFQFYNVTLIKTDQKWTDFRRFELYNYIFKNTDENLIYYMDCDSRFFNFRHEKYDQTKFENLINSINFDIMSSWELGDVVNVKWHLQSPTEGENKFKRNYTHGHVELINYLKSRIHNYEDQLEKVVYLESVLLIKKSEKIISYFDELITIGELIKKCDENIGRHHVAHGCGFCMSLFSEKYDINIIKNFAVANFFKPNFLNEIFLWGSCMEKTFKILN